MLAARRLCPYPVGSTPPHPPGHSLARPAGLPRGLPRAPARASSNVHHPARPLPPFAAPALLHLRRPPSARDAQPAARRTTSRRLDDTHRKRLRLSYAPTTTLAASPAPSLSLARPSSPLPRLVACAHAPRPLAAPHPKLIDAGFCAPPSTPRRQSAAPGTPARAVTITTDTANRTLPSYLPSVLAHLPPASLPGLPARQPASARRLLPHTATKEPEPREPPAHTPQKSPSENAREAPAQQPSCPRPLRLHDACAPGDLGRLATGTSSRTALTPQAVTRERQKRGGLHPPPPPPRKEPKTQRPNPTSFILVCPGPNPTGVTAYTTICNAASAARLRLLRPSPLLWVRPGSLSYLSGRPWLCPTLIATLAQRCHIASDNSARHSLPSALTESKESHRA